MHLEKTELQRSISAAGAGEQARATARPATASAATAARGTGAPHTRCPYPSRCCCRCRSWPAAWSVSAPAGCYPRDQLTPSELLPADQATIYAQQNPMGPGSLKGKNFLSAGALIGVNTVGQSLRNANLQLRSEPPNPQVPVSIFLQSTIQPDISHRPLEIGS